MDFAAKEWPKVLGAAVLVALLRIVYLTFFHPLSRYPGPLLARYTDYWRFRDVKSRQSHHTRVALHRDLGAVVRIGPNTLSISDPAYIPKIYGPATGFHKGPFYHAFQGWVGDRIGYNLFTTRDPAFHLALKQPVAAAYSLKSAVEFEPIIDECIEAMLRGLQAKAVQSPGKGVCSLGAWMQYFSFDVIAATTYGKGFGFLDRGEDVNNIIRRLDARMDVISPQSQMPWLDWLYTKNPVVNLFRDRTNAFATLAASLIQDRKAALASGAAKTSPRLFIDHFLDAQQQHPKTVDSRTVVIYTTTNLMAGSDTVAIALRTIFYMLLRPQGAAARQRLLAEIDAAAAAAGPEQQLRVPVTWAQSQQLPYLHAVIQEALRIHPPVGLPLERVVPTNGLAMRDSDGGARLPAGVQVGCHAWPMQLLDPVWGPDPQAFRPERWLRDADRGESVEAHRERVAAMNRAIFAFGGGSRGCMGRHFSMVQISKVVPSLLLKLRFELVDTERSWKTIGGWFVRQSEMDAFVELRDTKS